MLDISSAVQKIEYPPAMFSSRSISSRIEEDLDQGAWNNLFLQATPASDVKFKWTPNAVTAQESCLKSFVVEDTATESRTLEKNEDQVVDLISNIRFTRSIPDRESIAQRLFELLRDVKEEDLGNAGMQIGSLRSFYSFLQIHSNLKKPAIGLTPENEIYVSWRAGLGSVFSIHFLSSGRVRFALIAHNPRAERPVSLSGLANAEDLIEKVKPWGVLKWAEREGR